MTDVVSELAALRAAVREAPSRSRSSAVVLNRQDLLAALDRIEAAYAAATAEAQALTSHRDAVIAEAEQSASEILRQARLEEDRLVSDTEVFRLAQRQAEETLDTARTEAEALRRDADAYVEQRFAAFEQSLERTLGEVRRGIAHLSSRHASDDAQPSGVAHPSASDEGVLLAAPDAG